MLNRWPEYREWARVQGSRSRTAALLENGLVQEAASSDDGLTSEVWNAAARAYAEFGWLKQAALAYTLAGNRAAVAEIALRWLDAGLLAEAASALRAVSLPMTDEMLDRYERACRYNGFVMHVSAAN